MKPLFQTDAARDWWSDIHRRCEEHARKGTWAQPVEPDDGPTLASLPDQTEAVRKAAEWVEAFSEDSQGLLLVGGTGTGKTTIVECVAWQLRKAGHGVMSRSVRELLSEAKREIGQTPSQLPVLERAATCSVLVLDDVGVERLTDFGKDSLRELIERRYGSGRPLVVTSNLSLSLLEEHLGERAYSRLRGSCVLLPVVGADRRRERS